MNGKLKKQIKKTLEELKSEVTKEGKEALAMLERSFGELRQEMSRLKGQLDAKCELSKSLSQSLGVEKERNRLFAEEKRLAEQASRKTKEDWEAAEEAMELARLHIVQQMESKFSWPWEACTSIFPFEQHYSQDQQMLLRAAVAMHEMLSGIDPESDEWLGMSFNGFSYLYLQDDSGRYLIGLPTKEFLTLGADVWEYAYEAIMEHRTIGVELIRSKLSGWTFR